METAMQTSTKALSGTLFHAHTLWLFTCADLKTIVLPSTIFGLANALSASKYGIDSNCNIPSGLPIPLLSFLLQRSPPVLIWTYLNLLPFTIFNQLSPLSIIEDALNKPWRPLTSNRISSLKARWTMVAAYVLALVYSALISGGIKQSLALVLLGVWYNKLGGGDRNPLVRNVINALGYLCFISGAMEVALGVPLSLFLGAILLRWLGVIAAIVVTTMHTQDIYDQEGDASRGRRTVPLVVGDGVARCIIAVFMGFWGVVCPKFWGVGKVVWVVSLVLAGTVGVRTLVWRDVTNDKRTFVIWNAWMVVVYVLPLFAG